MKRWFAGFVVSAGCLGCSTVPAEPLSRSQSDSSPLRTRSLLPQIGVRVASTTHEANLLPQTERAAIAPALSSDGTILPLALAGRPDLLAGERIVRVERIASPEPSPEIPGFSLRLPSPSLAEVELVPMTDRPKHELTDTRFISQVAENVHGSLGRMWNGQFRRVLESIPHPGLGLADTAGLDPFALERNDSAWLRGDREARAIFRRAAKDSDFGSLAVDQLREWRNEPISILMGLVGGSLVQDTPEGGKLILGPQWSELQESDNPADIFRVRYLYGPFEARAETQEAWLRYRFEWKGTSFLFRTAYDYLDTDTSYQLGVERKIARSTRLRVIGGTGIGSEALTGFSPYPEDPREGRRVGIIAVIDRRF